MANRDIGMGHHPMTDRTRRIVRQYGDMLSTNGTDWETKFGTGWAARTTIERLTERHA